MLPLSAETFSDCDRQRYRGELRLHDVDLSPGHGS